MATMRAAFCTGKERIEVRETEAPEPGPGEVLVRVRACGVCGSDLHFYHGALPANPNVAPGHEFAGEVVSLGEGVTAVAPGQRVAVEPLRTCRECVFCRSGQYQLCPSRVLLGTFVAGGLAEYAVVPTYALYSLPEAMDFELGALVEPLAVAVHGLHLVGLTAGERVVVLGSGTIGLMSVLAARAAGAAEVIATYRHEHQARAALAAGASRVVPDGETSGLAGTAPDVVVETVGGTAPTLAQAIGIVRPGGRVCLLGLFTQSVEVNALAFMLKEAKMAGGITYCRPGLYSDFERAMQVLAAEPERARGLITHRFPLEETAAAFATAADKNTGCIKVQVQM